MKLSDLALTYGKEMLEVLRDKRTLLITLTLPAVVFPIVELLVALVANNIADESSLRVTRVCFLDGSQSVGKDSKSGALNPAGANLGRNLTKANKANKADQMDQPVHTGAAPHARKASEFSGSARDDRYAAELKSELLASKRIVLAGDGVVHRALSASPESVIVDRSCDLVLRLDPHFSSDIESDRPAQIALYDNAFASCLIDEENVMEVVRTFSARVRARRLEPFKIPSELIKGVHTRIKTVESEKQRSAQWTALVYTLMLMFVMSLSSMYPALDVITGERERGTLILLLLAPGDRRSYVCGKLLAVSTVTLLAAFLALVSVSVTLPFFLSTTHDLAGRFHYSLPLVNLAFSSIYLPPLAVTISACALMLSSYSRTFQQGQSLFAPLILLSVILGGLVLSCEESAPFFINLVPVANLLLCTYKAIHGEWNLPAIAATALSSGVFLVLLVRLAVSILDREEALFGIKAAPSTKTDYSREGFILFGVCLAAFFYTMPVFQLASPVWGLLLAQVSVIGLPALLVPKLLKLPVAKTLSLLRPRIWSLAGAVMLAPGLALLSNWIAQAQSSIMPNSEANIKALQDYLIPKGSSAWTAYVTIALAPAVCEELLFRGAIQGLMRRAFPPQLLCPVIGVLFGIMHGSSYRFLPTSIMGMILSWLTEYTGSIFPAMLLHASNNAIAVFESGRETEPSAAVVALALALAVAGLFALRQGRKPEPEAG